MEIEIDLNETHTKSFNSGGLIQKNTKRKFFELIKKLTDEIKKIEKDEYSKNSFPRVHNTILINGKRGVGKTSFILSMMDALSDKDSHPEIYKLNLCILDTIDPTLIETKEHVFLNIITSIKDKVENYYKCSQNCNDNSDSFREWKKSLKTLAGGLSMLEEVGTNHIKDNTIWDSPELILEKGLSNSKQGKDLERNFHKFIDESLKVLNKDAFFLVLDDIDTSLEKGISIMETLRKYLTSPKLIISMLGDMDLYSILARQLQWEKIDPKKILKDYEDGAKKYIPQIEHLEEQYLTKILKPENRIDLENLFDLKDEIKIKNEEKYLNEYLNDLVKKIYLTNNNYEKYYIETILTQPTRSILQILKLYNVEKEKKEKRDFNFSQIIKHTFYTTLKKKLESHKLLDIYKKEQYLNLLSMYIIKTNISRDNHLKLIPDFVDSDENISMLYLNALSNELFQQSKNYLDYFIKVGYALEQFMNLEIKDEKDIEKESKKFLEHIAIDSGESSSKIAKRLLTTSKINASTPKNNPLLFGANFIPVDNLKSIKFNYLSLITSKVNNSRNGSYKFMSFFNLLGFLADLNSLETIEEVENIKVTYSQILEFSLFRDDILEDNDFKNNDLDNDELKLDFDSEEVLKWIIKKNKVEKIPLFVLSKIWVRVSYTFNNIIKNKNSFSNYYEIFEMFIVSFLNAVYVEISLYKGKNFANKNFIKNPEQANSYYEKIKDYKIDEQNYTLFDHLFECPFLKIENFKDLEKITIERNVSNKKIKFSELSPEKQLKLIKDLKIKGFTSIKRLQDELRKTHEFTNKKVSDLYKSINE